MKGNSERIPKKNLKLFAGKPLFYWTLSTLLDCEAITNVIVNTDSKIIENSVLNFFPKRVIIEKRPRTLCGDFISMNKIIDHDINKFHADYYIQTHSTNPLLKSETISKALEIISNKDCSFDSIFSVTKYQSRFYSSNFDPINHDPNNLIRTQDLDPLLEENSLFYIFSKKSFYDSGKKRIGLKPLLFNTDKIESIDIDEPEDFLLAETIFNSF